MTDEWIRVLMDTRLMRSVEEFQVFEHTLSQLVQQDDIKEYMHDLYLVFDDNTEQFDVMWSLVHFVERIDEYEVHLVSTLPRMIDRGREWTKILLIRILNHPDARTNFRKLYIGSNPIIRETIFSLLVQIKEDSPHKFAEKVDAVLQ